MRGLELMSTWPGGRHAAVVVDLSSGATTRGGGSGAEAEAFAWASITKLVTAHAALVLVDDGAVDLSDSITPWGATLLQLLCHAGGAAPSRPEALCAPGTKRIYSSAGYELLAAHLERSTGLAIETVMCETVLDPLGMSTTHLEGSPAAGLHGTIGDLSRLLVELARPTLLSPQSASLECTSCVPELAGVVPGFGASDPCAWGLGPEVKGTKVPHWTPASFGPSTYGHFGQAGGFLVVEPVRGLGVCTLGDEPFGTWATTAWPQFLDAVAEDVETQRQ